MLFHSPEFLFYFLPFALLLHRVSLGSQRSRSYSNSARVCLVLLTLVFYGWANPWWLIPLAASIGFDFLWATLLDRTQRPGPRRLLVLLSVSQNLGLLAAFKYWDPIVLRLGTKLPWVAAHVHPHGLPLPAGISFYTFESLSFVIDIYRRQIALPKHPLEFFAFITMFPRFIAGPIVRYKDMVPQFSDYRGMQLVPGLFLFVCGLFLKLCLADSFAVFTAYAFGDKTVLDCLSAWLGVFAYTMQIYLDFSGYSLMAIGLGRCLGFRFPTNFNRPYLSGSIQEFWRRWHISLSSWLRDYLYVSLGGSRHGTWRTYRNLFLTMLIGGIWHGAGLTFIFWGAWHGGLLCVERALGKRRPAGTAGWLTTFVCVMVGWVLFRAQSSTEAFRILAALFRPGVNASLFTLKGITANPVAAAFCVVGVAYAFLLERYVDVTIMETMPEIRIELQLAAVGMFVLSLVFGLSEFQAPFLYFQF